jgi:hypothetical protein
MKYPITGKIAPFALLLSIKKGKESKERKKEKKPNYF